MWGITCYVRAAYSQFDEKVFQRLGDKVYGDMVGRNPSLRKEKDMTKTISFDFEDALDEREAEGIEQGIEKGEAEGRRKVALHLLKSDVDEETIRRATQLTKRELAALKKAL